MRASWHLWVGLVMNSCSVARAVWGCPRGLWDLSFLLLRDGRAVAEGTALLHAARC